jgi:hypothetical protein
MKAKAIEAVEGDERTIKGRIGGDAEIAAGDAEKSETLGGLGAKA